MFHLVDQLLAQSPWPNPAIEEEDWRDYLGHGNRNFWDYLVEVCRISFRMSHLLFPDPTPTA